MKLAGESVGSDPRNAGVGEQLNEGKEAEVYTI